MYGILIALIKANLISMDACVESMGDLTCLACLLSRLTAWVTIELHTYTKVIDDNFKEIYDP